MALKGKQKAFVNEYMIDLNSTQAAIRAGYSKKTAGIIGFENLRKPKIQEAIQEAIKKRTERTEITADWVLKNLVEIVGRCMQEVPVIDRYTEKLGDFTFNASGANKALEQIGRHTGGFAQEHQIKSDISVTISKPKDLDLDE